MNEEQYKEIISKMDMMIRLLASSVVKEMKTQKDKIHYLSSLGFGPTDIANILSTTSNTVNVALSREKKKESKSKENEVETKNKGG